MSVLFNDDPISFIIFNDDAIDIVTFNDVAVFLIKECKYYQKYSDGYVHEISVGGTVIRTIPGSSMRGDFFVNADGTIATYDTPTSELISPYRRVNYIFSFSSQLISSWTSGGISYEKYRNTATITIGSTQKTFTYDQTIITNPASMGGNSKYIPDQTWEQIV